jgi:hypothetical protein
MLRPVFGAALDRHGRLYCRFIAVLVLYRQFVGA